MDERASYAAAIGGVPSLPARLNIWDRLGALLARLGFNRMGFRVAPGLCAVGTPGRGSPVLVTANYKPSVDALRRHLRGIDAWVLVVDTFGINVWCAAGKGTFSAEEVARRVREARLDHLVDHRTLILPQLAAPGVAAHEVRRHTGFRVVYGPVLSADLPAFLAAGMKASTAMRRVRFSLADRLKLIPVELGFALRFAAPLLGGLALLSFLIDGSAAAVPALLLPIAGAFLIGTAVVPALLPWIPFRSFALKGGSLGLLWAVAISVIRPAGWLAGAGHLLLLPAIAAFFALNFTGSSTFTSQSGVNREIGLYARPMGISALAGLSLTIAAFMAR